MLIFVERKCLDLSEAVEQLSEKQTLLATLMESKKNFQKVAPEEFRRQIFQELKESLTWQVKWKNGGRRKCFSCCRWIHGS